MKTLILSLFSGGIVGLLFAAIRLPIPAPNTVSGILGIVGLFLGYLAWPYLQKLVQLLF